MSELEFELKREVENWVDREFNYIQLENLETVQKANSMELYELIEQPEPDRNDFLSNYGLTDEYLAHCALDALDPDDNDNLIEYCDEHDSFERYVDDQQSNNYPMWNTLFEFRSEPPAKWLEKAQAFGLGVINSTDSYNSLLFASSAGHSFYSAYWIPLYLAIFDSEREKYREVKYDHL